jgi:hypothetical protein
MFAVFGTNINIFGDTPSGWCDTTPSGWVDPEIFNAKFARGAQRAQKFKKLSDLCVMLSGLCVNIPKTPTGV